MLIIATCRAASQAWRGTAHSRRPPPLAVLFLGDLSTAGRFPSRRCASCAIWASAPSPLLGNHDLHLLAVAAGIRPLHHNDTLQEILDAPDPRAVARLVTCPPLAHMEAGALLSTPVCCRNGPWLRRLLAGEVQPVCAVRITPRFCARCTATSLHAEDDGLWEPNRLRCVIKRG